ncbi:MAG: helix-turn-helix transcriptional regulator [Atopobiaceae bacterium]|nr:helix-turn-helix transcriptional regulator [Atopobiaceae bacterium]
MWLWMAGSNLRNEIIFKTSGGRPGATPHARVQFQSHDNAVKTTVKTLELDDNLPYDIEDGAPYDFEVEVASARAKLDEEIKDACSVAAENLEEYRRLREITAAQVGEAMGISESTFRSKMRTPENMKLGDFLTLCAMLEVDPSVALGFVDGEDASAVRNMHRLGKVEDHRYVGEAAHFLTCKSGSYIPRHAVVPLALTDYEPGFTGDKTEEDDQWPRWFETDEAYTKYGPYFHAEWRDEDDGEGGSRISNMTSFFMEADGSIFYSEQEGEDEKFADEVAEYFESRGFAIQRFGRGRLAVGLKRPDDGDFLKDDFH